MNIMKNLALLGFSFFVINSMHPIFPMQAQTDATAEEDYEEYEEEEEIEVTPTAQQAPVMPLTSPSIPPQIPVTDKPTMPAPQMIPPPDEPVSTPPIPPQIPTPITETPPQKTPVLPTAPQSAPTAMPLDEIHKAKLEKINQSLKTIDTLKNTLKDLLSQFDEALKKGRNLAVQARTKSMKILQAQTPADAQNIKNQLTADLEALKKMQQNLQTNLSKNFQTTAEQIKSNIVIVENTIKELQQKGIQLKLTETKPDIAVEPKKEKPTFFARFRKEAVTTERKKDESFGRYLARRMGDLIIGIFGVIYTTYDSIKNLIFGSPEIPKETIPSSKIDPQAPPPEMPTQMPQQEMPSAQAEGIMHEYDQLLSQLEQDHARLESQAQTFDSTVLNIREILKHDQTIGQYIDDHYPWKETIINGVSNIIDGSIYLIQSAASGARKIFQYYLKPAAKQITHDVQEKLKVDQKQLDIPTETAQEEEQVVTPQAIPTIPQPK